MVISLTLKVILLVVILGVCIFVLSGQVGALSDFIKNIPKDLLPGGDGGGGGGAGGESLPTTDVSDTGNYFDKDTGIWKLSFPLTTIGTGEGIKIERRAVSRTSVEPIDVNGDGSPEYRLVYLGKDGDLLKIAVQIPTFSVRADYGYMQCLDGYKRSYRDFTLGGSNNNKMVYIYRLSPPFSNHFPTNLDDATESGITHIEKLQYGKSGNIAQSGCQGKSLGTECVQYLNSLRICALNSPEPTDQVAHFEISYIISGGNNERDDKVIDYKNFGMQGSPYYANIGMGSVHIYDDIETNYEVHGVWHRFSRSEPSNVYYLSAFSRFKNAKTSYKIEFVGSRDNYREVDIKVTDMDNNQVLTPANGRVENSYRMCTCFPYATEGTHCIGESNKNLFAKFKLSNGAYTENCCNMVLGICISTCIDSGDVQILGDSVWGDGCSGGNLFLRTECAYYDKNSLRICSALDEYVTAFSETPLEITWIEEKPTPPQAQVSITGSGNTYEITLRNTGTTASDPSYVSPDHTNGLHIEVVGGSIESCSSSDLIKAGVNSGTPGYVDYGCKNVGTDPCSTGTCKWIEFYTLSTINPNNERKVTITVSAGTTEIRYRGWLVGPGTDFSDTDKNCVSNSISPLSGISCSYDPKGCNQKCAQGTVS